MVEAKEVKRSDKDKGRQQSQKTGGGKSNAGDGRTDRHKGPPVRDILVTLSNDWELWHDPSGRAFATVPMGNHRENLPVRSNELRGILTYRFYRKTGAGANSQGLEEALRVIEALAVHEGPEYKTFLRAAEHDGKHYMDLVSEAWQCIEIGPGYWRIRDEAPVKFVRTPQMRPLPRPETGGSIDDLRQFLNVESDADFKLAIVWLLAAMRPRGPYPLLVINGLQGTAKSTATRVMRNFIDPNAAPLRTVPKDERELAVSAANSWVQAYDNLSGLPNWLSDALCRLSTGGGFATRRLHSDREEEIFESERPVIMNGISKLASRSDLVDRCVIITLAPISKTQRRFEDEFWTAFEEHHPFILGALLSALAESLKHLPSIKLEEKPRMADFARFGVAVERALGWPDGSFMHSYEKRRLEAVRETVEDSLVGQEMLKFARNLDERWEGHPLDLYGLIEEETLEKVKRLKAWPKSVSVFSGALKRLAPDLAEMGVKIEHSKSGDRYIFVTPV